MDRDDASGAPGDPLFERLGIDHQVGGVDVDEDRRGAGQPDRRDRRDAGVRNRDHLVAGTDPEGQERQVQGGGAGGDGDAVAGADEVGELPFEGLGLGAENELPGTQHPSHRP